MSHYAFRPTDPRWARRLLIALAVALAIFAGRRGVAHAPGTDEAGGASR